MSENKQPVQEEISVKNEAVTSLLEDFLDFIQGVAVASSPAELYSYLCQKGSKLVESTVLAGENALASADVNSEVTDPDLYLLHFSFPDRIKTVFLLVRDILLQLSIARLRSMEGLVSNSGVLDHFEKSKSLLCAESENCLSYFNLERKTMLEKPEVLKRKLESVKHFANPWKTYQTQFETINSQFKEIDLNDNRIEQTIIHFGHISDLVIQMRGDVLKVNELFAKKVEKCLEELGAITDKESLDQAIKSFDELINLGIGQEIRSESTMRTLEDEVNKLPTLTIPVDSQNGFLIQKKVDFRKSTQKWMDYEILPYLIDLWDGQEATFSQMMHAVTQIKSSLLVAKKTQNLVGFNAEVASLNSVSQEQIQNISNSHELVAHIEKELGKKFKTTESYTQDEYLKVPLQTNFGRLTNGKSGDLSSIMDRIIQVVKNVGKQVNDVRDKTQHQRLEIALEILETRNEKETPDHYHSLFFNKNFIGDLFIVKRSSQEETLEKIVNFWKKGQNRSLAVVGDPLSGKSTLLEATTHLFKSKDVHYLVPGGEISLEGRKFKMGKNLGDALNFVKRSMINTKPILVIDDLHVWRDKDISLTENTAVLIDFISSNSSKVFVLVGITNSLRLHLDSRSPFSEGFTNILETNTATFEEIYKAVMLRHGASHRAIFEKEGMAMEQAQLRKKIAWLAKKYDFNIGAVLQAWIFCTDIEPDSSIRFTEKETHLNDFLSTTEMLILKNCLLYGYSSDLELKNLFTDRYESEYKPAVRKLLNIGILDRDNSGYLVVKNTVRQDLYSILKYRELLA
jgi:energy-coupling factor transporter ATP-binding protein EcfA2